MPSKPSNLSLISKVYSFTIQSFQKNPKIYLPFAIFALIEFMALMLIYLSPRVPLRALLGPPISAIWGEKFLHYPVNFLLLSKLAYYSRMFLSVVFSSLLTGLAVAMTYKKPLSSVYKKYVSLFLIVLIMTAIVFFGVKVITSSLLKYFYAGNSKFLFLGPDMWFGPILTVLNFVVAIFVQALFTYAIPILIAGDQKLFKAILQSFVVFKRYFLVSLFLAGLPMLFYIPVVFLYSNTALLIDKFFPEVILLVAILSVIVNSLVIDPLVTISTALLYSLEKEKI
jgi:hypothetical protein